MSGSAASDVQWYCMRGERPTSPSTTTATIPKVIQLIVRASSSLSIVTRARFREFMLEHPDFALHLVEKPSPGTGATLLADVLTYPSMGRPVAAMTAEY